MQALRTAFSQAERYGAPYGFSTRVMARATGKRKRSPWAVPAIVQFAEAAVLLLVISAGVVTGKIMMSNDTPGRMRHWHPPFPLNCSMLRLPGRWETPILALRGAEMKNNILKFVLAASLILNLTVLATAGFQHYQQSRFWVSPFGKVMEKNRFLFEELSLQPEQMQALKSKAIPFRAEIDRRRQEIDAKRKELVALIRADASDNRAIESVIGQISCRQEEIQRMIAAHMLQVKASLDKGQQQKFMDLVEKSMTGSGAVSCPPGQHPR